MLVDNSMLYDLRYCPMRFFWRHRRNLTVRIPSTSLQFGLAIHEGLRVYNEKHRVDEAILRFAQLYPPQLDDGVRTYSKGLELISAWDDQFKEDGFVSLAREQHFVLPLGDEIEYCGRLDDFGDYRGQKVVRDYKTSTRWWDFVVTPNSQFDGYLLGGQTLFPEVEFLIVDMIGITKSSVNGTRKRSKEDGGGVESVFQRKLITRSKKDLALFVEDTLRWCQKISDCDADKWWPRNTDNCSGKYGKCPYLALCEQPEERWPFLVETAYREDKWDPLKGGGLD